MDSQRAIERLEEQQAKIVALLALASALLAGERVDRVSALAVLRWRLMRTMREYQLFKHFEIFDPLAASSNLHLANMARGMKERCTAIGEAYAVHVHRWSNGDATSTWLELSKDTSYIIGKINDHLKNEKTQAKLLLRDVVRIRMANHINEKILVGDGS